MNFALLALLALILPAASLPAATAQKLQLVKPEPAPAAEPLRLPVRTAPAEQAFLYSRATGVLAERRVDSGDTVKAGDLLAVIAAPEVIRAAEKASAAVTQAEARAALAEANLRRTRSLAEKAVLSSEEADIGEAAAKSAVADLAAAKAEAGRLAALVAFQQINAPFDGIVAERQFDRGDFIPGDSAANGRWLFHLMRVNELRALLDAPPATALALRVNQSATVEFTELPGKKFPAKVARTAGVIDPGAGTMRIELSLPNPDRVIPAGLNGIAYLALSPDPAAAPILRIPVNCLVNRDGRSHVALVREGKVAFIPVKTGRNSGQRIEILEGLSPDSAVILNPNALLQEGQSIP
jgi:RND family efflux transporter MFP subunit